MSGKSKWVGFVAIAAVGVGLSLAAGGSVTDAMAGPPDTGGTQPKLDVGIATDVLTLKASCLKGFNASAPDAAGYYTCVSKNMQCKTGHVVTNQHVEGKHFEYACQKPPQKPR